MLYRGAVQCCCPVTEGPEEFVDRIRRGSDKLRGRAQANTGVVDARPTKRIGNLLMKLGKPSRELVLAARAKPFKVNDEKRVVSSSA